MTLCRPTPWVASGITIEKKLRADAIAPHEDLAEFEDEVSSRPMQRYVPFKIVTLKLR
jgi:hypothetical protein